MMLRWTLFTFFSLIACTSAFTQSPCDESRLDQAAASYDVGRVGSTLDLLKPCLPTGFPVRDQRVSAYRLMALSYIARDSVEEARENVRLLLKADARYRSDPQIDPRMFTDLVSDLKPKWYTFLWRGNAWYHWAGRAVVVGGIASIPFLIQEGEADLPTPPAFPEP